MYGFSNFKCSDLMSDLESPLVLALYLFLHFRTFSMAEAMIVFRYFPSTNHLLELVRLPWPPNLQADDQFDFMYLACACITLQKFISCPGPYRFQVGLLLLFSYPIPRVFQSDLTLFLIQWGWWVDFTIILIILFRCVP